MKIKKTILLLSLFLSTVTLSAQTLIKASFQKGDTAVYEKIIDFSVSSMGGSFQAKQTMNICYVAKEANANGYELERTIINLKTEGNNNILSQFSDGLTYYLNNVPVLFQTDADGKIQKIINIEEVVGKASQAALKQIDSLYKATPEMSQNLPKEKMIMAVSNQLEEQNIIKSITENSFLSLYGKKLKTGDTENQELMQGIKVITTYDVSSVLGTTAIVSKSKSNMNEKEVKQMIINNIKKTGMGDDVVSQFENNWSQIKAAGMANVDFKDTDTYHFMKSSWLNDEVYDARLQMMGTDMTIKSNTKLIKQSWE